MKKIVCVLLLCLLCLPVFAGIQPINFNLPEDNQLNKQLECIKPLLDEANKTKNDDLYIKAAIKAYNIKKRGDKDNIKKYNDVFSASIIGYAMQRYNITKEQKYLKLAHKWTKIAIKDRTEQLYAIQAGIIISANLLDKKTMINSYDLLRCVNEKEANKYYNDFESLISQVDKAIKTNRELRNQRMSYALQVMGTSMQAAGNSMKTYNPRVTNFTTTQVGDTYYTNAYSY